MNKKKKLIQRILCAGLSITACMTLYPLQSVIAAPAPITLDDVYIGDINYDCGVGAISCPDSRTGTGSVHKDNSFKSIAGEKPIPVRPGYTFIDWEITFANPRDTYKGSKLKAGDRMTDWDSYTAGNIWNITTKGSNYNFEYYSLDLQAVWEPASSEQQNSIPISVSVSATPINVTLPTHIDIAFDGKSVEGQISDALQIINNSKTGNIVVQKVNAELTDSTWTFTTQTLDSYFQYLPFDANQVYLGFSKDNSSFTPLSEQSFDPGIKVSPVGITNSSNIAPFYLKAKTGGRSSKIQGSIMNLVLTIGFEAAVPDTGLEITDGTVTAYTGNSETLILPMNVTSINSKALANHPELKTVINNTGKSFDWYDALGETNTNQVEPFSEGSTSNVLIASQTTMDNYSEPFRSQLLSGEIKLTPDSTLTIDSSGMITDFSRKSDSIKADVVLPATKNGFLIKGIDDGTKDGNKIDGTSAAIITKEIKYQSPFTTFYIGSRDRQQGGIKSITMPNTIEKLGALSLAASLYPVEIHNIPTSLKSVGMGSFLYTKFDQNSADFSQTQLQVIDAYAFSLDYLANNTSLVSVSEITEIRLPKTIQTINIGAFKKNLMPNLTTIINPSGKSFDWSTITGSKTSGQNFVTGTIIHQNGNIIVKAN